MSYPEYQQPNQNNYPQPYTYPYPHYPPYPQHPEYPQYVYPVYPVTNTTAKVGMILSLVGLVTFGLLSIAGFIVGLVGLAESKQKQGVGREHALIAIWVAAGPFLLVVGLLVIMYIVGSFMY